MLSKGLYSPIVSAPNHRMCHVLLFVDRAMSPLENEEQYYALRAAIRNRWCKRMKEKHGRIVSEEFGIRVDPVKPDDADGRPTTRRTGESL